MDKELEALIDQAGRNRVFAAARALGWSAGTAPPAYVWRQIAYDILRADNKKAPADPAGKATWTGNVFAKPC